MDSSVAKIQEIEHFMAPMLDGMQMRNLHAVLGYCLCGERGSGLSRESHMSNSSLLGSFLSAKRLEGCSEKSLRYYETTLKGYIGKLNKSIIGVTTEDVRSFLGAYQTENRVSNVTVDNIRRIVSSFFSWLEAEDFIYKSPVRRIKKIKTAKPVKPVYSDETIERLRDSCSHMRDLAIVELLASAGIRVGELVLLNRGDIDLESRECIVHGKGSKERKAYFDARTKVHIEAYLSKRTDDNDALFVSLNRPYKRLQISGVEMRLRDLGRRLELPRVHPHKFRRTLATRAIDKGMPIEQVQVLLGHSKIDTTLCYAMVDQENVRQSHRKYIG